MTTPMKRSLATPGETPVKTPVRTPSRAFQPSNLNLTGRKRQKRERNAKKATPRRSNVKVTVPRCRTLVRPAVSSTARVAQALSPAASELLFLFQDVAICSSNSRAQNAASAARIEQLDGELSTAEKEPVVEPSTERDSVLLRENESKKTVRVALAQKESPELSARIKSIERDKDGMILELQTQLLTKRDAAHTRANEFEDRSNQMKRDQLEGDLTFVVAEHAILLQTNKNDKQHRKELTSRVADLGRVNSQLEANQDTGDHLLREQLQTQKTTENELVDKLRIEKIGISLERKKRTRRKVVERES